MGDGRQGVALSRSPTTLHASGHCSAAPGPQRARQLQPLPQRERRARCKSERLARKAIACDAPLRTLARPPQPAASPGLFRRSAACARLRVRPLSLSARTSHVHCIQPPAPAAAHPWPDRRRPDRRRPVRRVLRQRRRLYRRYLGRPQQRGRHAGGTLRNDAFRIPLEWRWRVRRGRARGRRASGNGLGHLHQPPAVSRAGLHQHHQVQGQHPPGSQLRPQRRHHRQRRDGHVDGAGRPARPLGAGARAHARIAGPDPGPARLAVHRLDLGIARQLDDPPAAGIPFQRGALLQHAGELPAHLPGLHARPLLQLQLAVHGIPEEPLRLRHHQRHVGQGAQAGRSGAAQRRSVHRDPHQHGLDAVAIERCVRRLGTAQRQLGVHQSRRQRPGRAVSRALRQQPFLRSATHAGLVQPRPRAAHDRARSGRWPGQPLPRPVRMGAAALGLQPGAADPHRWRDQPEGRLPGPGADRPGRHRPAWPGQRSGQHPGTGFGLALERGGHRQQRPCALQRLATWR